MVNEVHGHALACLVAADRYHHLDTEIRPERPPGSIVICDRYLASTLVLQARDGLAGPWLLALNEGIDLPDLAVILSAGPGDHHWPGSTSADGTTGSSTTPPRPGPRTPCSATPPRPSPASACPSSRSTPACLTPQQAAGQIADALAAHCASLSDHG